jgi:hypothetical protein
MARVKALDIVSAQLGARAAQQERTQMLGCAAGVVCAINSGPRVNASILPDMVMIFWIFIFVSVFDIGSHNSFTMHPW